MIPGKYFVFSYIFFSLMTSLPGAIAQTPDLPATVAFINKKLGPKCTVEIVHGYLIAKYFSDDGKQVREDKVELTDLAFDRPGYEAKEKVFYYACYAEGKDCVYRKMILTGNWRYYPRISFVVEDDAKLKASLTNAFIHLSKIVESRKYKDTVVLE